MQALKRWAHSSPNRMRVSALAVLIFSPVLLVAEALSSYTELVLALVAVVVTGEGLK